jgi:hypothetical protein
VGCESLAFSIVLTLGVCLSRNAPNQGYESFPALSPFAILVTLEVQRLQVARDSWSSAQLCSARRYPSGEVETWLLFILTYYYRTLEVW